MSFPMPPEGELRRDSRPTTGKAPCICLAIPLIACMGPLHNLSSWEAWKAILILSKHVQYKEKIMLTVGRYWRSEYFTHPLPSFVAAQTGIL